VKTNNIFTFDFLWHYLLFCARQLNSPGEHLFLVILHSIYENKSYTHKWMFNLLFDLWSLSVTFTVATDTLVCRASLCLFYGEHLSQLVLKSSRACRSYAPDKGFALFWSIILSVSLYWTSTCCIHVTSWGIMVFMC
jgi:hypothetical protein